MTKKQKKQKAYSIDTNRHDLADIFANSYTDTDADRLQLLHDKAIIRYRMKTITSGNVRECEIYPVWNTRSAVRNLAQLKPSRPAQRNLNDKNAVKTVIRLLNTNFTDADIWLSLTYDNAHLPKDAAAAQKQIQKYIRRLKHYAETHNLPELKYLYVTEYSDDEKKGKVRVHHHVITNFPDRDIAEKTWHGGKRTNSDRLQADESGYEGMARYITKARSGVKRYVASRNLKKPSVVIADCKFTKRGVMKIINAPDDAKAVFEKIYKGYAFTDLKTYTSDYVTGAYIYVKLRRQDDRKLHGKRNL